MKKSGHHVVTYSIYLINLLSSTVLYNFSLFACHPYMYLIVVWYVACVFSYDICMLFFCQKYCCVYYNWHIFTFVSCNLKLTKKNQKPFSSLKSKILQNNYFSHWILQLILEIRILYFPEFSNQIVSDEKKAQLQIKNSYLLTNSDFRN